MEYKVGFCQYQPQLKQIDRNLQQIAELLRGIQADLIVFPELATSGYVFNNSEELLPFAEDMQTGKTVKLFRNLAADMNISFVVGFPELAEETAGKSPIIYNSCFLANPDGSFHVYRKKHLYNLETTLFEQGDGGFDVVVAKKGVKIGMMICFDWFFPESARTLALRGAQIICHPTNLVLPWCQQAMITRSLENRVFTVTSNRTGTEVNGNLEMTFTGQSQITSPRGEVLERVGVSDEGVWITTINPQEADNKNLNEYNHLFKDRRPDKYEE